MAKDKENTTKNFALRLDAKTMEAIEKWAADEFRSVNGQIQWIINEALKKNKRIWDYSPENNLYNSNKIIISFFITFVCIFKIWHGNIIW